MYDTAQHAWDEDVQLVTGENVKGSDVSVLILNVQSAKESHQLQISYCVTALYRAIIAMTNEVLFCYMYATISMFEKRIGMLSITDNKQNALVGVDHDTTTAAGSNITALNVLQVNDSPRTGTIKDETNPSLSITYHVLGKAISPKEVSLVILEALAAAAPFPKYYQCQDLEVLSPDGGAAIVIESVKVPLFTYQWATRALKLLYQEIIVPFKRWGDIFLEIKANDILIGELRMLKVQSVGDRQKLAMDES
ncbi:MAG: hypothetical protein Q9182_002839 [Xanthomendoza sp. 2 TL-2023]